MSGKNIFLYIPNLIGYLRITLLGMSFYYMLDNHRLGIGLYIASYGLDALDGLAARMFNQSSLFGSMMDMLTDRVSTMCLLMTLGHLYSKYIFIIQLLLVVDIVSHWLYFFAASIQGKKSHKSSSSETNKLMRLYYENKLVLTSVCALEQLFFASLLISNFENNYFIHLVTALSWPGLVFKNYINILQICKACKVIGSSEQSP